jgi:hypothetical protein
MNAILESMAARAANGWQRAGSKFDFEVFAMPGGSVMAPALWVYSMVSSVLKRPAQDSSIAKFAAAQSAADAPGAAGAQRAPSAQAQAPGVHCDWSGCHCT